MHLRQGNKDYVEKVANAMLATDNLIALSNSNSEKVGQGVSIKGRNNRKQQGKQGKLNKQSNSENTLGGENALMDIIDKFARKPGGSEQQGNIAEALLEALTADNRLHNSKDERIVNPVVVMDRATEHREHGKHDETLKLLENLKKCITGEPMEEKLVKKAEDRSQCDKKGKLVSGKCSKPDDSDIKLVVKYTHETLDPKHIQQREFDALEFNFLIAGELELISMGGLTDKERSARIKVAKMMCYHKKYLDDQSLREGYDSIMKQIKQGKLKWEDSIGQKLHDHLDYRANVIL